MLAKKIVNHTAHVATCVFFPFSDLNKLHLLPLAHPTFVDITSCIMQRSMPRDKDDVHPSGPHRWTRSSTADLSPENGCIYIYIHLNTYIIYIMVSAGYSKNISDHCNFIAIHLENQVSGRVCLIEDLSKVDLKWEMASGCSNFRKVVRFDDPPQEKWLKPPVWKHQFDWQKWSAELRKSNLGTLSWVANEFNLCQIHMERIVVDDRYLLHHPNFSFFPT